MRTYVQKVTKVQSVPFATVTPICIPNPFRVSLEVCQVTSAQTCWIWWNSDEVSLSGLRLTQIPPYVTVTEKDDGWLVKQQWSAWVSGGPGSVGIIVIEGLATESWSIDDGTTLKPGSSSDWSNGRRIAPPKRQESSVDDFVTQRLSLYHFLQSNRRFRRGD